MKIVAIADTHGFLPDIPECDLLLIAGDICPVQLGTAVARSHDPKTQYAWCEEVFAEWLDKQPARHKVGIAGNHDFVFEHPPLPDLPWKYLEDTHIEIEGVRIHGYPWVPNLPRWAFYADDKKMAAVVGCVPPNTDILLTHGPPWGCGHDMVSGCGAVGERRLTALLTDPATTIKHHVFGHIHEGFGQTEMLGPHLVNATQVDIEYKLVYKPVEFEF